MTPDAALNLLYEHMQHHGLIGKGWKAELNRATTMFGYCDFNRRTLYLSKTLVPLVPDSEVLETVLHEVAHALLPPSYKHNYDWKMLCLALGGNGQTVHYLPAEVQKQLEKSYAWKGTCPKGHKSSRQRAPIRLTSCYRCNPVYSIDNLISWKKNGRTVPLSQMGSRYQKDVKFVQRKKALA